MAFRSLRDLLPPTLEGLGIAARVQRERARLAWSAAAAEVSAELAAGSEVLGLSGAALVVRVDTPALGGVINARHDHLVHAVNARLGSPHVAQVRVDGGNGRIRDRRG